MKTKNFESISISFVFVFLFWMGIRFSFHLDSVVSLISAILLLTAIVVIKRAAVKLSACLSGSQCGSVANSVGSFVSFNFPVCLAFIWLLVYFAAFPGYFCYDTNWFFAYANDGVLTTYQSAFQCFVIGSLLKLFMRVFNSVNCSIALITFLHMTICYLLSVASFALVDKLSLKEGATVSPDRKMIIAKIFFLLCPIVWMFSVCTSKDSLCSFLIMLIVALYIKMSYEGMNLLCAAGCIVCLVLCIFYRNNVLPALLLFLVVCLIVFRSELLHRYSYIPITLITSLLLYFLLNSIFISSLGVQDVDHKMEMISIPAVEIARVCSSNEDFCRYVDGSMIDSAYLVEMYNRNNSSSDNIRYIFEPLISSENGMKKFILMWLKARSVAFGECVIADLKITEPAWNIFSPMAGYRGVSTSFDYDTTPTSGFAAWCEFPGEQQSLIPLISSYIYRLSRFNTISNNGPLFFVVSVAPYNFLLLYFLIRSFFKSDKTTFVCCLLLCSLVISVLLGPVVLLRYYLPVVLCLPLIFSIDR